jgi:hypothetical protein
MTATHATAVADLGIVRVTFDSKPVRSDLTQAGRKLAAGVAHTLVGSAQNVRKSGKVWTADYSPLRKVAAKPVGHDLGWLPESRISDDQLAARQAEVTGEDDRLAYLERELARVTDLLAAVTGTTANSRPIPPAPTARVVPDKIAAKIAASAALACKVCRDYGVVRLTPRENGRVNFRSADGARAATAAGRSRKCECQARQTA